MGKASMWSLVWEHTQVQHSLSRPTDSSTATLALQVRQAYCPVAGTCAPFATSEEGVTVWVTSAKGRGPGASDRPSGASAMIRLTPAPSHSSLGLEASGRQRDELHLCTVLLLCRDLGQRQAPVYLCTTQAAATCCSLRARQSAPITDHSACPVG